jgi:hypothetical protein
MQRGKQALSQTDPIRKLVSCAYCHLRDLNPLKEVQKDTVCWGFEAGEEETRGCVQSGHDGLENKEMASTGAMFPPEIKDPNLLPIP